MLLQNAIAKVVHSRKKSIGNGIFSPWYFARGLI